MSYEPDAAVQEALTLATFEDHFDLQDLISTLSDKPITNSIQDPGPFDPLPFLKTFSHAVDSLLDIRKEVQGKTDRLEGEVKKAEKEYGKRLGELDRGFEAVGTSFTGLESRISSVGRTAIRIGETLETLHVSRSRAQSSSLLLSYYLSLSRGDSSALDKLMENSRKDGREGREGRMKLAVVLRRLVGLVKEDQEGGGKDGTGEGKDGKGVDEEEKSVASEDTRRRIEGFCELFEKDVLKLFDRWYRKGDPKMMAHCAKVLLEFNGGTSCVQVYVNQHDFFISKDRMIVDLDGPIEGELWEGLSDPLQSPPKSEPTLSSLYDEVRVTVSQEAQIIQAVFPNPPVVMQVFLSRVFAQVVCSISCPFLLHEIQQTIESLLFKASSLSVLSSLRLLHLAHTSTTHLIEDLKVYDFSPTSSSSRKDSVATESMLGGRIGSSGDKGLAGGSSGAGASLVAGTLDGCMEELFGPWFEGGRYLERESKSLGELFVGFLHKFRRYHETVHKAKPNGLFDRVVNQLATASTTSSTSTASSAAAALFKYSKGKSTPAGDGALTPRAGGGTGSATPARIEGEEGLDEEDGLLKLETGEKMLRWHAEAVGRCVELSSGGDVPKNIFALSRVLAEALGRSYIETALDSALSRIESLPTSSEPDLSSFPLVKTADLICHLWQKYTTTALLPLSSGSVAIRREMAIFNQGSVGRVEAKINSIVARSLDAILAWLAKLLSRQQKNDFKPKNDDISFERVNTEPCLACVDVLENVRDAARAGLSGKNSEAFLTEVGVGFHAALLDHLKKFPVSVTGALMLTKDLALYQDTIATFSLPPLNDRFSMLRQLGNLFVVQPEVLKTFMRESYLGRIDTHLLRPYLAQRVDYGTFSKRFVEEEGFGVDMDAATASHNAASNGGKLGGYASLGGTTMMGLGSRGLSRLGGLMKELDAGFSGPTSLTAGGLGLASVGTPPDTLSRKSTIASRQGGVAGAGGAESGSGANTPSKTAVPVFFH